MARRSHTPVHTQMEGSHIPAMPSNDYPVAPFSSHPPARGVVPTRVMDHSLKPSTNRPTPTQTAGAETRAPRPGTKQRGFGRSNE
jgi:hypothetical protein